MLARLEEKFIIHKGSPLNSANASLGDCILNIPLSSQNTSASISPVLRVAFNSSFAEGQSQSYILEDVRPEAFRLLVKWLYERTLNLSIEKGESVKGNSQSQEEKEEKRSCGTRRY